MSDVFDHPWLGGLFGDDEVGQTLSTDVQLQHILAVEAAYTVALGAVGRIDPQTAQNAASAIRDVAIDVDELREGVAIDGVVVPALVRSIKAALPDNYRSAVHSGLTSQDIIDTALILSLKTFCCLFSERLSDLKERLSAHRDALGENELMGRTRMQAALPMKVADRMNSWILPIDDHLVRLDQIKPRLLNLQLGGAVGNGAALGKDAGQIGAEMAKTLGLNVAPRSWHNRRDSITEFAGWLSLVSGSLGKVGQDVALMAQQGIDEIGLSGGGGSSAMPHKQNPVKAELLITLARYNATLLSAMNHALVHEQERSGSAWSLEWMVLPQMIQTTGRALGVALELADQIERLGK
ncbi:3-carboxy-cis,cis-muconate cycloisomerase [Ruegeria denitrificans]|uniref:3-carboxy-cis,cis-muconate cycloisomerase n=1 Tax=Ruegeria denitrificans TaxID=1715692 RepID=A0A0P1I898_9RHOB|nr:3-carboxy-cis,cis-muconate cycloisomerase [Ruegeria denitrificans]CUJ97035.1 3-carboxy-cis,cis-muconate cycloisomerase [Ruegeria denitrificans]